MIDLNTATNEELEKEQERLYMVFEETKSECFGLYIKLGDIQKEYDAVDKELKKRKGES